MSKAIEVKDSLVGQGGVRADVSIPSTCSEKFCSALVQLMGQGRHLKQYQKRAKKFVFACTDFCNWYFVRLEYDGLDENDPVRVFVSDVFRLKKAKGSAAGLKKPTINDHVEVVRPCLDRIIWFLQQ